MSSSKKHRGLIALDIDGTVTDHAHRIPFKVVACLQELCDKGWSLAFVTGRTYSFAHSVLQSLPFSYDLIIQNGADILAMPARTLISRDYLPAGMPAAIEKIYEGQPEGFIVYAGFEKGDLCYFRPKSFSDRFLQHLQKIERLSPEPWKAVETFAFASHEQFPLIKCFGSLELMRTIHRLIEKVEGVAVTLIKDPLAEEIYLNLITDIHATKGKAVQRLLEKKGWVGPVIAAGDDLNDISMLQIADFSIVMQTAPLEMHAEGDLIAGPASGCGIIEALKQAVLCMEERAWE